MDYLANLAAAGLVGSGLYRLIAIGLAVICKTTGVVNFDQGDVMMFVLHLACMMSTFVTAPLWALLPIAVAVGTLFGAVMTLQLFGMFLSIVALAMLLVGGVGSVVGAVLGAIFRDRPRPAGHGRLGGPSPGLRDPRGGHRRPDHPDAAHRAGRADRQRRTKRYWLQWPLSI